MIKKYNSWVSVVLTFCMLFTMVTVSLPVSKVYAAVPAEEAGNIVNESFDAYAVGTKPNTTGWSFSEQKGTISVAEIPDATDKSMKIQRTETDTYGNLWARKTLDSAITGTYAVRVRVMAAQTNATAYIMNIRKSSSVELANILFTGGNICYQLSTGASISMQSYAKDTWYDIVTVVDTDTRKYSVFIDGVKKIGPIDFKNTAADTLSYVDFQIFRTTVGTIYYNDFNLYTYNLSLNKTETTIAMGESETLSAMVQPAISGLKNITWTSENTAIVAVDPKGQVTAMGSGTTVITAASEGGLSAQCTVTVPEAPYVPVEGISVEPSSITLYTGESKVAQARLIPVTASNKRITWESSHPSVVSVVYDVYSGAATLNGLLPGISMITAISEEGSYEGHCMVTVKEAGDLFAESFDGIATGSYPATFNAISPVTAYTATVEEVPGTEDKSLKIERNASNTETSYYVRKTMTGNPSRAVISFKAMASQTDVVCFIPTLTGSSNSITQISFYSDGKIRAYVGNSWTSAVSELQSYTPGQWYDFKVVMDANTDKLDVYIDNVLKGRQLPFLTDQTSLSQIQFGIYKGSAPASFYINDMNVYSYRTVANVELSQSALDLAIGSSTIVIPQVDPASALFHQVQWSSSHADIVSVDANGSITALQEGTAIITATVTDTVSSAAYTATCTVNAYFQPVTEINLNTYQLKMPIGSDRKLEATVLPQNATNKQIAWNSTDPSIAAVDENGMVSALSQGTTTICAIAADGNKRAQCTVEVVNRQIQASYYVSPDGNDNNPGTEELPFKTLEKARDTVRNVNINMSGDIVIYLKEGSYVQEQTFTLDERDSGSNGYNVIYKAYPGEIPVLSGGKEITGWSLYDADKNIYRAPSQNIQTRQLYINGVRAVRARSEAGLTDAVKTAVGFTTSDAFLAGFQNIRDLEFVFHEQWTQPRCGVDSIELADGLANIKMKEPGWSAVTNKGGTSVKSGPVYYENAYELLDKEGEWYLDTAAGYFYYKPRSMEDMSTVTGVAPVLEELVKIEGSTLDAPVHNLSFEGLAFSYNTWMWPSTANGLSDAQNNHLRYPGKDDTLITAAVTVQRANHISFESSVFSKLGSTGLKMIGGVQDSVIQGNKFCDISGSAVNVGEPTYNNPNIYNPQDLRMLMRNVKVINNYIHDIGVEYASAAAVSAGFPVDSEFSHNQIFNIPYSAFHVGYGWTNFNTSVLKNTKIENNYIHDIMGMGIYDGGGIYTLGRTGATMENPNRVSGNYIQNQMDKYAVLYADDGNNFWSFTHNVIDLSETPVWEGMDACWAMGKTKDLIFDQNYTTTAKYMNLSVEAFAVTNTYVYPDANWPEEALAIINHSGLEQEYDALSEGSLERAYLPSIVELDTNETYKLNVIATKNKGQAADISSAIISYRSENESIAKVDNEGVITALGTGKTVVRTEILMGEVIRSLKTEVYVNDALEAIEFKNMAGDSRKIIRGVPLNLEAYGKTTLGREVEPETVSYTSSHPEIISVDSQGTITGNLEGMAEISVSATYRGISVNRVITLEVIQYSSEEGLTYEAHFMNAELNDVENWKVYGTNSSLSSGSGGIAIATPSNLGTYEGRQYQNELLTFHMGIQSDIGWEVIQFRNQTKDKSLDTAYAVVIKPDVIELQRFNNGQRTVIFGNVTGFTSTGGDAYPNDVLPFRKMKLVQVGAVNEEEGVRIILNIDGKNIFYFLDKDASRIEAPGYFSVYARYGTVELNKTPEVVLTGPDGVKTGEMFSVTGSVYSEQSLELKQIILKYDSQIFDYEGAETRMENVVISSEDITEQGIVRLNFSGSDLTVDGMKEVFSASFRARQSVGASDIYLDNVVLSDGDQNTLRTVAIKKNIEVAALSGGENPTGGYGGKRTGCTGDCSSCNQ